MSSLEDQSPELSNTRIWLGVLVFGGFVGLIALAAVGLVLVVIGLKGGLRQGQYIDWVAVGALAQIAAAVVGLVVVGGLYCAVEEMRERAQREAHEEQQRLRIQALNRIQHLPYLRVDVAFPHFRQPGLRLPIPAYVYSPDEVSVDSSDLRELAATLAPSQDEAALILRIYVTNLQSEPLAIANDVELTLGFEWQRNSQSGDYKATLTIRYLAPGQTFCIDLLEVGSWTESLAVKTIALGYQDIAGGQNFGGHGAVDMLYYLSGGSAHVKNTRGTIREAERS